MDITYNVFNFKFYNWFDKLNKSGVEGLEPPNGGTKTRSLTTWRYPIDMYILS
jgi:hypothetical protein